MKPRTSKDPPAPGRERPDSRVWWVALAVTFAASTGLVVAAFNPAPHTGGDNAAYVSLAYSLVTDGAYRELFDPAGAPHTKYPPVFPAVLALLVLLGARTWVALKTVAAAATVATSVLTYLWAERRLGPVWALGVALLFSASSAVVYYSHWILSDPLFLVFTLLALWALGRSSDARGRAQLAWVAVGVSGAALAYFTRSAGLPLLLVVGIWLAKERRWRWLATSAVALAIPVLLWSLRGRAAGVGAYASEFWLVDPYDPGLGTVGVAGLAGRLLGNAGAYLTSYLPGGIVGGGSAWLAPFGLALVGLAAAGWARSIRVRVGPPELLLPLYAGLILLWPEVWSGDRFALPLFPLLFLYAAELVREVPRRLGTAAPALLGGILFLLAFLPAMRTWTEAASEASACAALTRTGGPFACYGPRVEAFAEAAAWSGANLPSGSSVLTRKPRLFFVLGGIPSRTFPFDEDPGAHLALADEVGARYALVDEWDGLAGRYVVSAIRSRPGAFCALQAFGVTGRTQMVGILAVQERRGGATGEDAPVRIAACGPEYVAPSGRTPYPSSGSAIPLLAGLDR